ncbi:MAG: inner membrane CreD family protein, partial [Anaerolineae bacterium]
MKPLTRIVGVGVVFGMATVGWFVLGESMTHRTSDQSRKLHGDVKSLWGRPIAQEAPAFTFHYVEDRTEFSHWEGTGPRRRKVFRTREIPHELLRLPSSTHLQVHLSLDQRTRGLIWYSLYNVRFGGTWTYTHASPQPGELDIRFKLPHAQALYDDFTFVVDGRDWAGQVVPRNGVIAHAVKVRPGQTVRLRITYASRGLDTWRYLPGEGVTNLEDFHLAMTTDFPDVDFPSETLSPSAKRRTGDGWALHWRFKRVITGHGIGMIMPQHIQPGELAAALSYSAPVSLFFFFTVLLLLGTLRKIDIHPVNYLLLAAAFFAFHLLFSYLVDHVYVVPAFIIASVVSIVLVVSYLRLVVSPRFAFIEAGLAQGVYLIGFSLAHFWEGYTGLTVTVLV